MHSIIGHEFGEPRTDLKPAKGGSPNHEVLALGEKAKAEESYRILRDRQNAIQSECGNKFINSQKGTKYGN